MVSQRHLDAVPFSHISHTVLHGVQILDYDREMALVADCKDSETGQSEIIGVGRFIKSHSEKSAEVALLVPDPFQRQGFGYRVAVPVDPIRT